MSSALPTAPPAARQPKGMEFVLRTLRYEMGHVLERVRSLDAAGAERVLAELAERPGPDPLADRCLGDLLEARVAELRDAREGEQP